MSDKFLTADEEAVLETAIADTSDSSPASEHKPIFCLVGSLSAIPPPEFSTLTVQRIDESEASDSEPAQIRVLAAWIEAYPSITEAAKVKVPKP